MLWEALPVATMAVKPDWGGEEGPVCTYARTTTRMIGCSGPADALELLSHAVCQACNHSLHCELVGQGAGTIALYMGGREGRSRHVQRRTPVLLCMVCSRHVMAGLQA